MISKKHKRQIIFLVLAALWGMLIFYLSSQPDLASGFPPKYDFVLRKLAHMFVFGVLTYLIAGSLERDQRPYLLFVIIAALVYALIDEVHQSFIPGRYGTPRDILIDSIGVYFGVWFYKHFPPHKLFS
jgi:VanZ family protein